MLIVDHILFGMPSIQSLSDSREPQPHMNAANIYQQQQQHITVWNCSVIGKYENNQQ